MLHLLVQHHTILIFLIYSLVAASGWTPIYPSSYQTTGTGKAPILFGLRVHTTTATSINPPPNPFQIHLFSSASHHFESKHEEEEDDYIYTEQEMQDMEDRIVSLSLQEEDSSRRANVASIFSQIFSQSNHNNHMHIHKDHLHHHHHHNNHSNSHVPEEEDTAQHYHIRRFCALFQRALIKVGNRVQQQAQNVPAGNGIGDDNVVAIDSDDDVSLEYKTTDFQAKQVWALIDMLVQSKSIIQRYSQ